MNINCEIEDSIAYRILGLGGNPNDFKQNLDMLEQNNYKRLEKLYGICARLQFAEQIRHQPLHVVPMLERNSFSYQSDRLATYLSTTCIDIVTGEAYQHFNDWINKIYEQKQFSETWNSVIDKLTKSQTEQNTASVYVESTNKLYKVDYQNEMSIRRAFREFIHSSDDWLKKWLFNQYIVETLNSEFEPQEPKWENISEKEKSRQIGHYLYDVRNFYTHTVISYQPIDFVQRTLPQAGISGFVATIVPPLSSDEKHRRVVVPSGIYESDIIRLLIVAYIRRHWLNFRDNETTLDQYWRNR